MAISRFSTSRLTQGLPKYQSAWDQDAVQQGALVPLVSSTIGSTTASDITFNNISQDYQDLMIVFSGRKTDAAYVANVFIAAYNSTIVGSPFGTTVLEADGVSPNYTSYRYTSQSSIYAGIIPAASAQVGIFGTIIGHVFNYKNTNGWKPSLWQFAAATDVNTTSNSRIGLRSGSTQQTTAVNTVNVSTFNASIYFVPGTTVTVYGIKAGV